MAYRNRRSSPAGGREISRNPGNFWSVRGPFSGVGPRNYQRSDMRLVEDVSDRLTRHGQIDARNISVGASQGIVALEGSVNTRTEKYLAEDLAFTIPGVREVENMLKVARPGKVQPCGELHEGMDVVGPRGSYIGKIVKVRDQDFLVDRPAAPDVYVPFNACKGVNGKVMLNIRRDDIDSQDWPRAE